MSSRSRILNGFGIIVLLLFLLYPPIAPLTALGMKAIGILLFTIIWWATLGIGYPSLIAILLIVTTGVMSPEKAFAVSWGGYLVLFMIGCFGLSEALRLTGFPHRLALWLITRPFVTGHPWRLVGMFLLACTIVGGVMPRTCTTIIFLTIATPLLEILRHEKGDSSAAMFIMAIPWTATAAAVMTPSGHPGNFLLMDWLRRDFGYNISFLRWMVLGIPIALLTLLLLLGFFRYVVHPDLSKFSSVATEYARGELNKMGRVKLEEELVLGVFIGVVVLWLLPGMLPDILPGVSTYVGNMGYAIPPLLGACLLCVLSVRRRPLLTFRAWMYDGVEWSTTALVATIGAFIEIMGLRETGIAEFLTNIFRPVAQAVPWYLLLFIILLWGVLQNNATATVATMTLVYSVMVPVAVASGGCYPVALGLAIAAASNFIFILPISSAAHAMAVGSGWVSMSFMARYGIIILIPTVLFLSFICYPLACLIFP